MAYQKLQASSSFAPIPSDTVDIPNPTTLVTNGTTTSAVTDKLVDTTKDFVALGVLSGAIVYNTASGSEDAAYVTAFETTATPNDTLVLSKDIMGSTEAYTIYNEATKGAVLYAGHSAAANITVTMAGGSKSVFKLVPAGAFLPIQVTRLWAGSTYLDIIALW
ncbi:MAG: hypothetical protein GKR90_27070 [Pseudomonadales bacterium]|nr:hypothetical protein [Pseudomonadales bacterium]